MGTAGPDRIATAEVAGLRPVEVLHRSARSIVFRAHTADGLAVVVKRPARPTPPAEEVARYQREAAWLARLAGPGVPELVGLFEVQGSVRLVTVDRGGRSLAGWLAEGPLPASDVLDLLVEAARVLGRIHDLGVVHRDIDPANLVWTGQPGGLQLVDFGLSVAEGGDAPQQLVGTLRYVSPEQTGRTGARVDWRSDLYSLGATAWHLLVGRPPFEDSDHLALVHAHLARRPESPTQVAAVPACLSAVVLRLLEKDPELRYQGAPGLLADLERCRVALAEGREEPFPLGRDDAPIRFRPPARLYGRERELQRLQDQVRAARRGGVHLALVSGPAGGGKSALLAQVQDAAREGGAWVGRGAFQQQQGGTPLQAWREALAALLPQLLATEETRLRRTRARLLHALGDGATTLCAWLPELAALLGEVPAGSEATGSPGQLHPAIASLVATIASPERPLLLLLDNLQWARSASIELLDRLAHAPGVEGLVLVCAHRPDEVPGDGVLAEVLDRLAARAPPPALLALAPLDGVAVASLVADALRQRPEAVAPLAEVLARRSGGNPFHLRRLLREAHDRGLLHRAGSGWTWAPEALQQLGPTDNVVDSLFGALDHLPAHTERALAVGALLGMRFPAAAVQAVLGHPADELGPLLAPAVQAGLLDPEGPLWGLPGWGRDPEAAGRFTHERIHEAVLARLPAEDAPLHCRDLARWLAEEERAGATGFATVFDLLRLYRTARPLLTLDERLVAGRRALGAGRQAAAGAAFDRALNAYETGLELVDREAPELWQGLVLGALGVAEAAGDRAAVQRHAQALLDGAARPADAAPATVALVHEAVTRGSFGEALDHADRTLQALGDSVARRLRPLALLRDLATVLWGIGRQAPEALVALPATTDPRHRATQAVQVEAAIAVASLHPRAVPTHVLHGVAALFRQGVTAEGAFAWTGWALLLGAGLGRTDLGVRYCELAARLAERLGAPVIAVRARTLAWAMLRHWRTPLSECLAPLAELRDQGLALGEAAHAFGAAYHHDLLLLHLGRPLAQVHAAASRTLDQARLGRERRVERVHGAILVAVDILRGQAAGDALPAPPPSGDAYATATDLGLRLLVGLFLPDPAAALAAALAPSPLDDSPARSPDMLATTTYRCVALLQAAADGRLPAARARRLVRPRRRLLRRWARHQPPRSYRLLWLDAWEQVLAGRPDRALALFERAVDLAAECGHRHDGALIAEHGAEVAERTGHARLARALRREALDSWRQWGATALVARVERDHPELDPAGPPGSISRDSHSPSASHHEALDLQTVLRAARALGAALEVERVQATILDLAVQHAGAERGVLLLRDASGWEEVARTDPTRRATTGRTPVLLDDPQVDLPASLLRRVLRTGHPHLVTDAARSPAHADDPYVQRHAPRSLACLPVADRGELAGLLYLEHRAAPRAFTERHLQVLDALSGQMAVALSNAQLYDESLALTRAYERFVPKQFLAQLGKRRITEVALGDGVEREMTVLFSDIRSFTTHTERMTPAESFAFVNEYLGHMEPLIAAHGGFIDKYVGDAIMALFPEAPDALDAATAMLGRLASLNEERERRGDFPVRIGIGLNTGRLMLGTVGGTERMDSTVISDAVNLAARVEGLTRLWGCSVLVTESTRAAVEGATTAGMRRVDRVRVKGKRDPVDLHEVFEADPPPQREGKRSTLERFSAAVDAFQRGELDAARDGMEAVLIETPDDEAAWVYRERCARLEREGLPYGWDGVMVMSTK